MASAAVTAAKKSPSFEIRRDPALNSFFEAWPAAVCFRPRGNGPSGDTGRLDCECFSGRGKPGQTVDLAGRVLKMRIKILDSRTYM